MFSDDSDEDDKLSEDGEEWREAWEAKGGDKDSGGLSPDGLSESDDDADDWETVKRSAKKALSAVDAKTFKASMDVLYRDGSTPSAADL